PCGTHISSEEIRAVEKENLRKLNGTTFTEDDLSKRATTIYVSWNSIAETAVSPTLTFPPICEENKIGSID
ncbi:hypothetical protein FS842_002749, partial [Serendipita sp. 407]